MRHGIVRRAQGNELLLRYSQILEDSFHWPYGGIIVGRRVKGQFIKSWLKGNIFSGA